MTPECISRIGNKWYGAHNKTICTNMTRSIVRNDNIQGLSYYGSFKASCGSISRGLNSRLVAAFSAAASTQESGQHAYRFLSDSAAALVVSLFQQTQPDDRPG